MAFEFLAALTGATSGVATAIEERNKELQKNAEDEIKIAMKAAQEQTTKMQTRRSELKETADLLSTYSQGKLTKTQIAGLLQTPAAAKEVANKLKSARSLEDIDFGAIYKLTGDQAQIKDEEAIPSTIDRLTRAAKPTVLEPTAAPRGAFGLPTTAYSRTLAAGEKAAGMSLAEMRATARGVAELSDEERIQGTLDLSQFSDPEAITAIQGRIRDRVAKDIPISDPANSKDLKKLKANAVIKDMFDKKDGEGADKPRTTSAISSIFSKSLAVSVDPFVIKGVVRLVPETGDYVPVAGGSVEDIAAFQKQKNDTIKAQAEAIGIINKEGKIIGGRNASDALIPYANIEGDKIVSWKTAGKPAAPATPTITEAPQAIPKTADGKSIDATKLISGQRYTAADGTVRTWNGMGWQ